MTDDEGERLLRRAKRWRIAKWICFVLLAASIFLALQATMDRLQKTVEMIDSGTAGSQEYRRMAERASLQTIIGLSAGCVMMAGYILSLVMHQRAKTAEKVWRTEHRRATLAELDAGEADL